MQAPVGGNSPRAALVTRPIAAAASGGVAGLSRARSGQLAGSIPAPVSTWLPALNSRASAPHETMGTAAAGGASVLSGPGAANPAARGGSGELATPAEQLLFADRVRALQPSLRDADVAAAAAAIQASLFLGICPHMHSAAASAPLSRRCP